MNSQIKVFIFCSLCTLSTINAAVIQFTNLDADLSNNGGLQGFTPTLSTSGQVVTYSFNQTGDIDGAGIADDTLSFDILYTAFAGSTVAANGDVTLGTQIQPITNNINFVQNNFEDGDTLGLEIVNINYIDGEGDETIAFDGFNAIAVVNFAQTPDGVLDVHVGLAGATAINLDPTNQNLDITSNGADSSLFFTIAPGDGPVRLRDVDFQFHLNPIPEPSTSLLLSLILFGSMFIRRRKAL